MTHGSLYSGIGGWLLAARWAGIENIFTCEIDDFCNKVLDKHFPDTDRHYDIKETDFTKYAGRIDILSTSDPCQPFSFAGKRGGTTDDRFLWPFTIEAVRAIKPAFVVFENVPGFISMAFETVASDLEKEGYTVESFIIPACGVGAWHRRDRLWVVAYSIDSTDRTRRGQEGETESIQSECREAGCAGLFSRTGKNEDIPNTNHSGERTPRSGTNRNRQTKKQGRENESQPEFIGFCQDVSDTNSERFHTTQRKETNKNKGRGERGRDTTKGGSQGAGGGWSTKPRLGGMVNGLPSWMDYFGEEPDIPRVAKGKKDRVNRLKALGNSIYPPIAFIIFEAIKQVNEL